MKSVKPNKIYVGDCRKVMRQWNPRSIDMCVTSPPYWGLRDYNTNPLIWDNDVNCEHVWDKIKYGGRNKREVDKDPLRKINLNPNGKAEYCNKCGAWKGSLGLEPDFNLYIKHLVEIFDQVKRVLKDSGSCWVNIGDIYGGNTTERTNSNKKNKVLKFPKSGDYNRKRKKIVGYTKSLVMIPFRFAIEMVNHGWILRNTIIWHKPNCMPSSAKDRFTVDFEYLFFFSKKRKYYFEQQFEDYVNVEKEIKRIMSNNNLNNRTDNASPKAISNVSQKAYYERKQQELKEGKLFPKRNMRSVWKVSTASCSEAHFAIFPQKLVEVPIKAGCPKEICIKCGKPRVTVRNTKSVATRPAKQSKDTNNDIFGANRKRFVSVPLGEYLSDCGCDAGWESGIILDPFAGSGTTAIEALRQKKKFVLIELNRDYAKIAYDRIKDQLGQRGLW